MKRVLLFIATNIAILVVITIVMRLFGLDGYLTEKGLDYRALAIFSILWGSVGSFISLAMSKWMAKKAMGVQVIEQARTEKLESEFAAFGISGGKQLMMKLFATHPPLEDRIVALENNQRQ